MCLDMRYDAEKEKRLINRLPAKPITVYRWVRRKGGGGYVAVFVNYSYHVGLNHAVVSKKSGQMDLRGAYKAGFHSYKSVGGARRATMRHRTDLVLIKAHIRKEWITAVGQSLECTVFVTDRITAPSCRNESAIVQGRR